MSTQDFLARTAFNDLEASIELALSQTEGFRDEAENFADLARRGIRLVPPGVVANLSSFPANPEGGDAVFVESEDQIYFFDSDSSTWKDSGIIGSVIWGNVQGTLSDQTDLQTALDEKVESWGDIGGTLSDQSDLQTALDDKASWSAINNDEEFYESGTVTLNFSGVNSGSADMPGVKWIRQGEQVTIFISDIINLSSLEGTIEINGFPFVSDSTLTGTPLQSSSSNILFPSGASVIMPAVLGGTSSGRLRFQGPDASVDATGEDIDGNSAFRATITYMRQ